MAKYQYTKSLCSAYGAIPKYEDHYVSFQTFFVWALLLIVHTLKVISFGGNALVVPFQQLLEGPMEVLLCERVNELRHSLFHLLNCLITTATKLRRLLKVTGSNVWTIGTVGNCLDAHLGQIVCDKDGVVDWCIVLQEMPLTWFCGCPRGVMVKAMHCGIVVREFVLQSRYYVHFRANILGKGMNPLILPPAMGK